MDYHLIKTGKKFGMKIKSEKKGSDEGNLSLDFKFQLLWNYS